MEKPSRMSVQLVRLLLFKEFILAKTIGTSELIDVWASSGTKTAPSGAKTDAGWAVQEQPPAENENFLNFQSESKLNHVLLNGVPLWNATTSYVAGASIVNSGGFLYVAVSDNTNSTPPNANWLRIGPVAVTGSLTLNVNNVAQLDGDEVDPGANKVYGTNGSGEKGWIIFQTDGFTTGDYKSRFGTGTLDGYVRCNGRTIGDDGSGASERANADTEALYTLLWNESTNAEIVVSGGRGASAAADFAAGKTITLPDARNSVMAFLDGMGSSDTSRITSAGAGIDGTKIGARGGSQTHQLTEAQMPAHAHTWTETQTRGVSSLVPNTIAGGNPAIVGTYSKTTDTKGSSAAHNNTQPTLVGGTLYIKL